LLAFSYQVDRSPYRDKKLWCLLLRFSCAASVAFTCLSFFYLTTSVVNDNPLKNVSPFLGNLPETSEIKPAIVSLSPFLVKISSSSSSKTRQKSLILVLYPSVNYFQSNSGNAFVIILQVPSLIYFTQSLQ
jgi:hypothetical protein